MIALLHLIILRNIISQPYLKYKGGLLKPP